LPQRAVIFQSLACLERSGFYGHWEGQVVFFFLKNDIIVFVIHHGRDGVIDVVCPSLRD